MQRLKQLLARLWGAECGIASVEYAMLLALVAGGIMMGMELLSGAVSDQMGEVALMFGDDGGGFGDDGGGDNCGNDGGAGQGSGNTC